MTHVARVVMIGDAGVGKTTLIHRMTTGEFIEGTIPTIAAGVSAIDVPIDDVRVPLQFWDTAGQELYRSIVPIYFKGAMFAILAFAVNDEKSFEHLDAWLTEIRDHSDQNIEVVLVGTKYDCHDKAVTDERARELATKHNLKLFFVSAVTGQNVNGVVEYLAIRYGTKRQEGLEAYPNHIREQPMVVKRCC
jgi:small GTP-binding protein